MSDKRFLHLQEVTLTIILNPEANVWVMENNLQTEQVFLLTAATSSGWLV